MYPSTDKTLSRTREDTNIANREYEDNLNKTNQYYNNESRNYLYTALINIAVVTLEENIK